MKTKRVLQVLDTTTPNTGREPVAGEERQWESFPQPCGWALHWDNEGLLRADLPQTDAGDTEPLTGARRPEKG
jgi:hypothetical protein